MRVKKAVIPAAGLGTRFYQQQKQCLKKSYQLWINQLFNT